MQFNEAIKKAREQRELSQDMAAKEIEKLYPGVRVSGPYLSMIENGSKTNLTTNLIAALIDFYKLPPDFALTLFKNTINKNSMATEEPCRYNITTIAAHNDLDPLADLSPEARKSVEDYIEFARKKYPKKEDKQQMERSGTQGREQ